MEVLLTKITILSLNMSEKNWRFTKTDWDDYFCSIALTDSERKLAIFRLYNGREIQVLLSLISLRDIGEQIESFYHYDDYSMAMMKLDWFFIQRSHPKRQEYAFCSMIQRDEEPFEHYMERLCAKARECQFFNEDEKVMEQLIDGSNLDSTRRDLALQQYRRFPNRNPNRVNHQEENGRENLREVPEQPRQCSSPETPQCVAVEYLNFHSTNDTYTARVGRVKVKMQYSNICSSNIIDRLYFNAIQQGGAIIYDFSRNSERKFVEFGTDAPLKMIGCFHAELEIIGRVMMEKFYVVDVIEKCLIGVNTAKKFGIINRENDYQNMSENGLASNFGMDKINLE